MQLELPKDEFEILKQDKEGIHLFDKVVNKIYVFDRAKKSWKFPAGSRQDVILRITGVDFNE